jgi:SulP family sulfate permease
LPAVTEDTRNAAIVLILRGEEDLGSTFLEVLSRYATDLQAHNSKLLLAEVGPLVETQMDQTKIAHVIDRENIFLRTEKVGQASIRAWDAAQKWLAAQPAEVEELFDDGAENVDGQSSDEES